ncbi:hypothetical protein T05_997 [Trichinella murrelli]|uniref:Uncharacterized protein n=1 Tax=Trichinella murrelli TaxID=144512 RepID=A0A0V0ST64_9BILA|nr:hypothetical protein T05_997 [Trichinella murrelli]
MAQNGSYSNRGCITDDNQCMGSATVALFRRKE